MATEYPLPDFHCADRTGEQYCYVEYDGRKVSSPEETLYIPKGATITASFRIFNNGASGKVMVAVIDEATGLVLGDKETEVDANAYWADKIEIDTSQYADEVFKEGRKATLVYASYYFDGVQYRDYKQIEVATVEVSPGGASGGGQGTPGEIDLAEYLKQIPNSAPCTQVTVADDRITFRFQENCVDRYFDLSEFAGKSITLTAGSNDLNGQLECENDVWNPTEVKFIEVYPEKTVTLPTDVNPLLVFPTANVGCEVWVSRYAKVSSGSGSGTQPTPSPSPAPSPTPAPSPSPSPSPVQPPVPSPHPTPSPQPKPVPTEYCTVVIKPVVLPFLRAVEVVVDTAENTYRKIFRSYNDKLSFRSKGDTPVRITVKESLSRAREYSAVVKPGSKGTIRYKWNAVFEADNLGVA